MNPFKRIFSGLSRKVFVFIGIGMASFTLIIVGILFVRDLIEDRSINREEQIKMAYNLEQLDKAVAIQSQGSILYFEDLEELFLDMDYYRKSEVPWVNGEVGEFWIPADRSDIDYFTEANHRLVWNILKDAP